MVKISSIVAVNTAGYIGKKGKLLYHLPEDLAHFRKTTEHSAVLMGRETFLSLGRVLADRLNIVLTSKRELLSPPPSNLLLVSSLQEAVEECERRGERELFICGGARVYEEGLPLSERLHLTLIHDEAEGDTRFEYSQDEWEILEERVYSHTTPSFTIFLMQRE